MKSRSSSVIGNSPLVRRFSAGWIDFKDRGAHARKGAIGIDQAIATLIQRERG